LEEIARFEVQAVAERERLRALKAEEQVTQALEGAKPVDAVTIAHVIRRGPPGARETIAADLDTIVRPDDILVVRVDLDLAALEP
jgi:hypothetical protein